MDGLGVPETRSRSRSKTPFTLRSQCDGTNCTDATHAHGPVKKVPTVPTVAEESLSTPSNVRASTRTTRKTIIETQQVQVASTSTSSVVTAVTATNGSSATTRDQTQELLNNSFEENTRMRLRTSTPIQAGAAGGLAAAASNVQSPAVRIGRTMERKAAVHDSILTEDGNDHVPYREYRKAGEYWNKYPKTDYTYSRLSPHRRELAPGIIAMPNMSRRSLVSHHERVHVMAEKASPGFASYIRQRYLRATTARTTAAAQQLAYDSHDETDDVTRTSYRRTQTTATTTTWSQIRIVRWFLSVVTTIWSVFGRTEEAGASSVVQSRLRHQQGWFSKLRTAVSRSFFQTLSYVYLALSTVLFFDTWLVRSSTGGANKKRYLLLLLVLLPLLLLTAWQLHDNDARDALLRNWATLAVSGLPQIAFLATTPNQYSFDLFGHSLDFGSVLPNWQWSTPQPDGADLANGGGSGELSEQQYQDLLVHLNRYVDQYVGHRIAAAIDKQSASRDVSPPLSAEHLAAVSALISERIAAAAAVADHKSAAPNVDSIVAQVLQSHRFDERLTHQASAAAAGSERLIAEQRQLIRLLQQQVNEISAQLTATADGQQIVGQQLGVLQAGHRAMTDDLASQRAADEARLTALRKEFADLVNTAQHSQSESINARVRLALADVLGFQTTVDGEQAASVDDLRQWMRSVFVAKAALEERLRELGADREQSVRDEIERSAGVLMHDITERIRSETLVILAERRAADAAEAAAAVDAKQPVSGGDLLGKADVWRIVREALRVYDADKTGLVDYALESAGGEIVSTRCTETYHSKSAQISVFGIPLWYATNTPRTAITPSVQPGQCWAFQGFPGFLVLKLNANIHVTGFTLEHIPRSVSPNGNIDSAPKTFTVWGLTHEADHDPLPFGTFEFQVNGSSLQYFRVAHDEAAQSRGRRFNLVELRIESNHGNANYTCLYRFRVHGQTEEPSR